MELVGKDVANGLLITETKFCKIKPINQLYEVVCVITNILIRRDGANPTQTLTFTMDFPYSSDTVYLAYCYPYSYSYLQDRLLCIQVIFRYMFLIKINTTLNRNICYFLNQNDEERSQYCKIRLLCRSLAGNSVHVLTITSPTTEDSAV